MAFLTDNRGSAKTQMTLKSEGSGLGFVAVANDRIAGAVKTQS